MAIEKYRTGGNNGEMHELPEGNVDLYDDVTPSFFAAIPCLLYTFAAFAILIARPILVLCRGRLRNGASLGCCVYTSRRVCYTCD